MSDVVYGRIVTEVVYKGGLPVSNKQTRLEIIQTPTRKDLLDAIFDQLKGLEAGSSVCFEVFAGKHTPDPARIEVTNRLHLD